MDEAKYEQQSRLKIPDDPLHPDNRDELYKYLRYCWRLLVQCEVLATACGRGEINWGQEVRRCIQTLFFNYPSISERSESTLDESDRE